MEETVLEELYKPSAPPVIQTKRSNVEVAKLSAKSLNKLPQASFVQKQQTPKDEGEFLAPLSMALTVYVSQGMRDQEAIQKLIVLERKTTGLVQTKVLELIELTPFFTQATVGSYIE